MQSNEYFKNYVAKNNVKITCDICNCQILKFNKPLHERTQKHQKNVEIVYESSNSSDSVKRVIEEDDLNFS